jgi:hypothetical protein
METISNIVNFIGNELPVMGAVGGLLYGIFALKEIREETPYNKQYIAIATIGGPAIIGFVTPRMLHYLLTSRYIHLVCVVGGVTYCVNAFENDQKTPVKQHFT